MVPEARKSIPHSHYLEGEKPQEEFILRTRDALIAQAIQGSLGLPPSGDVTSREAQEFNEENYLHTELAELIDTRRTKRTITVDTRYVPVREPNKKSLVVEPEIAIVETSSGILGETTDVDTIRRFPANTGRAVVETIHRLVVGVLIDGGRAEDVVRIYDNSMQSLNEGSGTPRNLIEAFRQKSPRGGFLSYNSLRYAESIPSPQNL